MKTKIIIIVVVAISLLSFTLISTSRAHKNVSKQETKAHSGFAIQDRNQF